MSSIYKSVQWVERLYVCGNRINLVHDSDFHASLQSSGMRFCFHLTKNKEIRTVIYIYHIKIQKIIFLIRIHIIF